MGFQDWLTDPKFSTPNARDEHKQEVYKRVEQYTMQYDKYTLTKELGAKGVPVGPVLDWNELENDPDLNEEAFSGQELIIRELGATVLEEIHHRGN